MSYTVARMELVDRLQFFTLYDVLAVAFLLGVWTWIGWRIEYPNPKRPSVAFLMDRHRRDWMQHHVTRNPRVLDAIIMSNLRNGMTFFASGCMIAIGGILALIGNTEPLIGVARDLTLDPSPKVIWELKLLTLILFLANAFLKFVWAHRLFGYASILMGAIPNEADDPNAYHRAEQAAYVSITASRNFNRGLRAIYFTLAALAWLLGPLPLFVATLATVGFVWRREFASVSRRHLMNSAQT